MNTQSPVRERAGAMFQAAARWSIAALLFLSPSMMQLVDVQRRQPPVYAGYTDFFVYPSDLFLVLAVAAGLLAPLLAGKPLRPGPWYLTVPLAALVTLGFVTTLTSVDPLLTVYHSLRFLLFFGLYLVLVNTPLDPKWVAIPLALAVVVQGMVAILQFTYQSSIGLQALGELSLNPADTGPSILRYDSVRILRAYGLTDHPNLLGGFLAFALIFILGYYPYSAHGRARYFLLAPFAIGVVALFYTFSRGAELALGIGVVVMLAALWRRRTQRFSNLRDVAILAVVAAAALSLPLLSNERLIAQRVGQGDSFSGNVGEARSLNERDELTESANRIFYQRQLLGVGNGALALGMYYLDKDFPQAAYDYQPAHLVLLVATAELGLFGGLVWLWLMLAPLIVMWRRRAQILANPWMTAVAAGVLVMLTVGFVDYYPWFWQSGRIWQWGAWGLFAAFISARGVNE